MKSFREEVKEKWGCAKPEGEKPFRIVLILLAKTKEGTVHWEDRDIWNVFSKSCLISKQPGPKLLTTKIVSSIVLYVIVSYSGGIPSFTETRSSVE